MLAKIDHILSLARRHNLPIAAYREVFGHVKLAFQYGRLISADLRTSELEKYDRAFESYLKTLVEGEDKEIKEELKKCQQLSGNVT